MRLIYVCTGTKFDPWYVDNLDHMINKYSGLQYDERVVITEEKFEGVFNKLQMFDLYRDGQNLYFDLDVIIKGPLPNLIRQNLTVLHAWWREPAHTPLNSSIISWTGDCSHVYNTFIENSDYFQVKYNRGMDQFIYENCDYEVYDKVCYSYRYDAKNNPDYNICLFNQRKDQMLESGWWDEFKLAR
jgi:hypothetical protein